MASGKTPSKVLSNIVRLVDAARLREGGSLATPDARLPELSRDVVSYLPMFKRKQGLAAFEALWRSSAGRVAVVHVFLSALRVLCDPLAVAPGHADGTAAMTSGASGQGPYDPTKAVSRTSAVWEGANKALAGAAGILARLFLFAAGSSESELPIRNRAAVPAAAAEMAEELLRGSCLPLLSRLLASGVPGFACYRPHCPKATANGATMLFTMTYSLLHVCMDESSKRGLVFSPQLPSCRLLELWARAAVDETLGSPRTNRHQLQLTAPDKDSYPDLDRRPLSQHSVACAMRNSMGLLLPVLLRHRSEGGEPLRAVLSGPCLQYLVALQAVSQLHAADGGTLYGLPPAAVLPPELAVAEGHGSGGGDRRQVQAALSCDVLTECVEFWESCVTVQPRVPLGPLRNRCLVNLCMRLSRVALASLEGVGATAALHQFGAASCIKGKKQQHEDQGAEGPREAQAGNGAFGASSQANGVANVTLRRPLEAGKCVSVALQSLNLAATVLRGLEVDPRKLASSTAGRSSAGADGGTSGMESTLVTGSNSSSSSGAAGRSAASGGPWRWRQCGRR